MNEQVSGYINQAPEYQKEIMKIIRIILHEHVKGVNEQFKWNRPVFNKGVDFMYFKTAKAYVTIGFFNYQKLEDPDHLLEGNGKDMRHIKLKKKEDIDELRLKIWFDALTS